MFQIGYRISKQKKQQQTITTPPPASFSLFYLWLECRWLGNNAVFEAHIEVQKLIESLCLIH